jgi:regulator of protease activity HflC (stomatin/prohibitin superfamily)
MSTHSFLAPVLAAAGFGEAITVLLILLLLAVVVFAFMGLKIIRQSETMIIERLGRYHRSLESGVNILWPIIDRPRAMHWRYMENAIDGGVLLINRQTTRIDLREAVYDFPRQNVITKDNVQIIINAIVYFQVTDAKKSVYEIANLPEAIEKLTQTTLRNLLGELDLDECLTSRDTINRKLGMILDEATHKWGVKVNRLELQDITPPHDIQAAMEKQMRAERDRRASILTAEGDKASRVLEAEGIREAEIQRAEGQKQAAILRAEGEAQARLRTAQGEAGAIQVVSQALGQSTDPAAYLIAMRYVDTLSDIAGGQNNKVVYMPYEATGVIGALGVVKELFAEKAGAKELGKK